MASFDPLASSQVTVDPALKPKPSKELAVRRQQLIEMFMNQGFDQPTAEQEADRYLADYPVVTGQQVAAPAPQPAPAPAAPEAGPMQSTPVAPVNLGRTWGGARSFTSEEDRDNYQHRPTLTRDEIIELKAQGATEAEIRQMQMSQQDIDMLDSGEYGAGQGWVPVYDPLTGRQTFKQRAPAPKPMIGGGHIVDGLPLAMGGSEAVTGQRRIGERVDNRELQADLRNPELERLGYQIVRWDGPNGPEYIYHMNRPDDANGVSPQRAAQLAKYDKVKERRQLQRIAGSAGVPIADARAAMQAGGMDAVRDMAADQRTESQQDRMKRFQAQIQLGGGRLSPQAIAMESLINGLDPERQAQARQFMLPGADNAAKVQVAEAEAGPRAKEVDARITKMQADIEEARALREQQKTQFDNRLSVDLKAIEQRMEAERLASAERMAGFEASMANNRNDNDTRRDLASAAEEAREDARQAQEDLQNQQRIFAFQQSNPGLFDLATGRSGTAAAAALLKQIARKSDRFQFLPGGGFGLREATAMNDELLAMADQAQRVGIETRLADPAYRRQLIEQYGYASGWSGGRGGWFGDFWQPMPEGL